MSEGLLWTSNSSGSGSGIGAGSARRSPVIRVYDIISPNCMAELVTPPDLLGPVISGAVPPSLPHLVYLGHEGGHISYWSLDPSDTSLNGMADMFDSGTMAVHAYRVRVRIYRFALQCVPAVVNSPQLVAGPSR